MPVPSPRNKILPARGNFTDLQANVTSLLDGEICYAIDQDQYYQNEGGTLVSVGATKAQGLLADTAVQPTDSIDVLSDVDTTTISPVNGQALIWNSGSGQWVPGSSGGAQNLDDLLDVNASNPNSGDVIAYSSISGNWEAVSAPPADISGNSIGDLSDVTLDSQLLQKDFGLVYDGSQWVIGSPPVILEVHNQSGSSISKGTPVYVAGTHSSGKPLVRLADASSSTTSPAIGLAEKDISNGSDGYVMLSGLLTGVDTSTLSAGDALYVSTTAGVLINVRPTGTSEKVQKVGIVTRAAQSAGSILIIGAGRANDINNELVELIGAGDRNATDLGIFAGETITDYVNIKTALGELEGAVDTAIQEAPNDSQAYVRQSQAWTPITSVPVSITSNSLNELQDVTITGAEPGEALIWNGSNWVNGGDLQGGSF